MIIVAANRLAVTARHTKPMHVVREVVKELVIAYACHVRNVGSDWLDLVHECIANPSVVLERTDLSLKHLLMCLWQT